MNQSKFGHFLTGALIGVGLGILLAPRAGSETREDLRKSFKNLTDSIKNIDIEATKALFLDKLSEIQTNLSTIDAKEAVSTIQEKAKMIEKECDELIKASQKEEIPAVEKAALEMKQKTTALAEEMIENIEKENQSETIEEKKETKQKKQPKTKKTNKKKSPKKKKN